MSLLFNLNFLFVLGKKLMAEAMTLDDHLLHEILSRLSAKALGRFILTSKKWKALISDSYLKTIQAQRSTQNVLGILGATTSSMGGSVTYYTLEHDACEAPEYEAPDTSLGLPGPQAERISIKGACNGLLLIKVFDRILVCNPTTKNSRQLPDVKISYRDARFGLAFDPAISATNFKVVATERVIRGGFYKFYVYSFEANTWRLSNATIPCTRNHLLDSAVSVFFNGALHWLRKSEDILAFNVEQEVAYNLALPEELRPVYVACYKSIWLGVAAGRISLAKFERGDILVWVLEDYGSRRWEFKHRIEPQGTGYYSNSVPVFYDGEKCVLVTWESRKPLFGLAVYRIYSRQWDKIRSLKYWMDDCLSFIPDISHMLEWSYESPALAT